VSGTAIPHATPHFSSATWRAPGGDRFADVAALRVRLWEAGFRPVAVYTVAAGKRLNHEKPGKHPYGDAWTDRARRNPPEAVTTPPKADTLNTGILCDGWRVFDFDIDNLTLAKNCQNICYDMFGEAPTRFRDNSPHVAIVYRAADGEPPKIQIAGNLGKIEVLGRGQQFVAFGDHISGTELQWVGDAPGEVTRDDIPAVTEEQIAAFLTRCATIIGAKPPNAANGNGEDHNASKPQADPLRIADALHDIPNDGPANWDWWNRVAMAVWAATGGSAMGWFTLDAWSARNAAYDPNETAKRWDHFKTSPPTKIGAGTIFHMAEQARRDRKAREAQQPDAETPDAELLSRPPTVRETDIPRRIYIVPGYIQRGVVTEIVGPGGHGKSLLFLAWAVASALGAHLGSFRPPRPMRVASLDVEDDLDEQAILRMFGKHVTDLDDRLLLMNPSRTGQLLCLDPATRKLRRTGLMTELLDAIHAFKPDLAMLNPLGELHDAEENDNGALRHVVGDLRVLAKQENIGLLLGHHTRKGAPEHGNADAGRGASSIGGVVRKSFTLYEMTPAEAQGWKIDDHRRFFRLDGAKANYDAKNPTEWFERKPCVLDNQDHVVAPWTWLPPHEAVTGIQIAELMAMVEAGDFGQPWTKRLGKYDRSISRAMEKLGIESRDGQQKAMEGLLAAGCWECAFKKPDSKPAMGLRHPSGGPDVPWK
jgi:AAA domain/Primase C terminal 2 (PriCT-2)/Bifunctional DNA primase/polymerase, N-terminal